MAKFCSNCGSSVRVKDKFCQECGTKLTAKTRASKSTKQEPVADSAGNTAVNISVSPQAIKLGAIAAIAGLILALGSYMLIGGNGSSSPDRSSASEAPSAGAAAPTEAGNNANSGHSVSLNQKTVSVRLAAYPGDPRKGWLGAHIFTAGAAFAKRNQFPGRNAVVISRVLPDSPAEKGGIVPGDVLLAIDGNVSEGPLDLIRQLAAYAPGATVSISLAELELTPGQLLEQLEDSAKADMELDVLFGLANMYADGGGFAPKNDAKALSLWQTAAENGSDLAMYNVATFYNAGRFVAQDRRTALRWYQRAADKGNADAQFEMGISYIYGRGVAKNESEGVAWLRRAADQNHPDGTALLAEAIGLGQGTQKNTSEAVSLHKKGVELGSPIAMVNLGVRYVQGVEVEQDLERGADLLRRAADQGDALGIHSLGWIYAKGLGVPRNVSKAAELVITAIKAGNNFSKQQMLTNSGDWGSGFRVEFQRQLNAAGVYHGKADGSFGAGTMRAIESLTGSAATETQGAAGRTQTDGRRTLQDLESLD
jgi:TPR repeat protein